MLFYVYGAVALYVFYRFFLTSPNTTATQTATQLPPASVPQNTTGSSQRHPIQKSFKSAFKHIQPDAKKIAAVKTQKEVKIQQEMAIQKEKSIENAQDFRRQCSRYVEDFAERLARNIINEACTSVRSSAGRMDDFTEELADSLVRQATLEYAGINFVRSRSPSAGSIKSATEYSSQSSGFNTPTTVGLVPPMSSSDLARRFDQKTPCVPQNTTSYQDMLQPQVVPQNAPQQVYSPNNIHNPAQVPNKTQSFSLLPDEGDASAYYVQ